MPESHVPKNEIVSFIHCGRCLDDLPSGISPKDFSRIQVGITADGWVQVWCNRHDVEVGILGHADPRIAPTCERCG